MWAWLSGIQKALTKFSVVAMLREQLALSEARVMKSEAENVELKAKIAVLSAELKLMQEALDKTKTQYERLQKEHEEEIRVWRTVEFRRGKRTFGYWLAFCPSCHLPLTVSDFMVNCSKGCGWKSEMNGREISDFLESLEKGAD